MISTASSAASTSKIAPTTIISRVAAAAASFSSPSTVPDTSFWVAVMRFAVAALRLAVSGTMSWRNSLWAWAPWPARSAWTIWLRSVSARSSTLA